MRIALVRGPNLNPWELANFDLPGDEVVAFGSKRGAFDAHGLTLPVRRLPSPADAVGRLPARARAALMHFGGSFDYLHGLERALAGFDIAHAAELANPYTAQAVRARDAGAVRRVVATVWENIPLRAPENRRVGHRTGAVAAGVDRFIAITEAARLHLALAGVPDDRIEVLPMGIDLERFRPADERLPEGPLRVLSVCRLVPEKGVEDLVVAIGLLARDGIDAALTLAGTGPSHDRLIELAVQMGVADRVRLEGSVPYGDLDGLYRASDVFVLASGPRTTWREQFGFAIVEAMATGIPVIAGNSGSLAEVVGDPEQLVTPHDAPELAAALAHLAGDAGLRGRRGTGNRRRAEERYDRRAVATAVRAFYERALADRPRSASA